MTGNGMREMGDDIQQRVADWALILGRCSEDKASVCWSHTVSTDLLWRPDLSILTPGARLPKTSYGHFLAGAPTYPGLCTTQHDHDEPFPPFTIMLMGAARPVSTVAAALWRKNWSETAAFTICDTAE